MAHILLGVSGGIAAYKAADLVSQLVKAGHTVRVMMTPSATRFVGPLTFEAMSGHPAMTEAPAQAGTASLGAHFDQDPGELFVAADDVVRPLEPGVRNAL